MNLFKNLLILNISCEGIFGSGEGSLKEMIDEALKIPSIIVPIIVIGFGMWDLGKAVISSKEDEMKKAQSTFIKRILIGVCVLLAPAIIDLIMYLADIVWNGQFPTC